MAAIGLPALRQARKSANESAAVARLPALASAAFTYSARHSVGRSTSVVYLNKIRAAAGGSGKASLTGQAPQDLLLILP